MSSNKSFGSSSDYFSFTDLVRKKVNDEEVRLKLKQVREVTNCNEEFGLVALHDCNYNVEYAINKILYEDGSEHEWQTKKAKHKKLPSKDEKVLAVPKTELDSTVKITDNIECNKSDIGDSNKDQYINGKTFKNFSLINNKTNASLELNLSGLIEPVFDYNLSNLWNGKSIIFENKNFPPMTTKDITVITKRCKTPDNASTEEQKEVKEKSLSIFKSHCTTKPPPKVLCSLNAPVQIINKNITHHSLPKLKFGDTDFFEESPSSPSNNSYSTAESNVKTNAVEIEDHSVIKVGPKQKSSGVVDQQQQLTSNFLNSDVYGQQNAIYYNSDTTNKTQSNLSNNNMKNCPAATVINNNKVVPSVRDYCGPNNENNYSFVNHSASAAIQSSGNASSVAHHFSTSFNPVSVSKETVSSRASDAIMNNCTSTTFSTTPNNFNHAKSTIYLLPNVVMNPMNGLYMTVTNPVPSSALSPPIAPIHSQYNMGPNVYYEESQNDDVGCKAKQFNNQSRQFPRTKRSNDPVEEQLSIRNDYSKAAYKPYGNFPLSQKQLSKSISLNYPVYFSTMQSGSPQMFLTNSVNSNSISQYPTHHYQTTPDQTNYENSRKRNIPIQSGSYGGKAWS